MLHTVKSITQTELDSHYVNEKSCCSCRISTTYTETDNSYRMKLSKCPENSTNLIQANSENTTVQKQT